MVERIVLIRAVNVGGAKLPMAQLRSIAEGLGATTVSTYIDSEVHLRYAVGAGTPQLTAAALARSLGVPGTARNLDTVKALLERAG